MNRAMAQCNSYPAGNESRIRVNAALTQNLFTNLLYHLSGERWDVDFGYSYHQMTATLNSDR